MDEYTRIRDRDPRTTNRRSANFIIPAAVAAAGISALGGALSGKAQAKTSQKQIDHEERMWAAEQRRKMELAPMRDRLLYQMNQRLDMPQSSGGLQIHRNESGGFGGFGDSSQDARQAEFNTRNAAYKPGAGGTAPWVQAEIIRQMGIDPGNVPNWNNPNANTTDANGNYTSAKYGMPGRPSQQMLDNQARVNRMFTGGGSIWDRIRQGVAPAPSPYHIPPPAQPWQADNAGAGSASGTSARSTFQDPEPMGKMRFGMMARRGAGY